MEIERKAHSKILKTLKRGKSILLFGPRHVGKTTLLKKIKCDLFIQLAQRSVRLRYERDPSLIEGELQSLYKIKKSKVIVIIDEIQKIPEFMDPIQDFIDQGIAQFILTGSSARKLRRQTEVNLLPGRVVTYRLDSLSLSELEQPNLKNLLLYGSLPGIYLDATTQYMDEDLKIYVDTYLDEEIRVEAQVEDIDGPHFKPRAIDQWHNHLSSTSIGVQLNLQKQLRGAVYEQEYNLYWN